MTIFSYIVARVRLYGILFPCLRCLKDFPFLLRGLLSSWHEGLWQDEEKGLAMYSLHVVFWMILKERNSRACDDNDILIIG